jgi:hypothetical protein
MSNPAEKEQIATNKLSENGFEYEDFGEQESREKPLG